MDETEGWVSILSARLVNGRYQLHTMLGRGGMASVWAGIDTRLDRPVAVKLLDGAARADPMVVQRLDREARTVAGLAHPSIVAVYDVGTDSGVPYLVMELVDGESLQHRLARGPIDVCDAVGIARQTCDALAAAHGAGVVHCDVTPDNILLTRTGAVKVCDFGIARLQRATQVHRTGSTTAIVPSTSAGSTVTVGTCEYMAPEQATGDQVSSRTDLYALGCVLYAMLAGHPPFTGDSPKQVMWRQVHEAPVPVRSLRRDVPADLDAAVMQLLAKRPADRPGGAAAFGARLAGLPAVALAPTLRPDPATAVDQPPSVARAAAAVLTRTKVVPTLDAPNWQPPERSGLRIGPLGIAAVAVGTAIITAVLVALFAVRPQARPTVLSGTPTTSAAASPTASLGVAPSRGSVDAVRSAIQAQALAGELNGDAADELMRIVDDLGRAIGRGRTRDIVRAMNDLRDRLNELQNNDKITPTAYGAILAAVDQLALTLPSTGGGGQGEG
jgi:eukaryotic-like serine/threonine-protein kinase